MFLPKYSTTKSVLFMSVFVGGLAASQASREAACVVCYFLLILAWQRISLAKLVVTSITTTSFIHDESLRAL